ncbi:type III secretion system domain-containing protein [Pandoraea anhela]|uniref:Type III secretion system subunit n=1 Tax=Pandoraea anhela TaxID=2508295 RepID=A0A5E4YIW4_9BURK|nr:type III secretion system domain-containing protein [Pandoraea anhela]VVE48442.1 hypothetical protein PAN31108_04549 [Pandoraea anhela]
MIASTRLACLIWQPGLHMDDGWWDVLGLSAWKAAYRRHPACRLHVDRLLIERRGWPSVARTRGCVPAESDVANTILNLLPNLRRVALAYGLRWLGCPDYLLLGTYRRALSRWLDAWQCDRLLLMRRDWPSSPEFPSESIASAALAVTGACLDAASLASPISDSDAVTAHMAARILLPPPDNAPTLPSDLPVVDDIWPRLAALERMLCMSSTMH